jgi:hypothetical protein
VGAEGGREAMQLRIAEQYIQQFGNLARESTSLVIPANVSDLSAMIALATRIMGDGSNGSLEAQTPARRL